MARIASALVLAVAVGCFAQASAHICLLNPVQRGGYNVSSPGNMACFHPQAPCGLNPATKPTITLLGGTGFDIVFQQNLNHYNPGFPGFLDVAYHTYPEPSSDAGFTTLATVPDYWAHLQAMQTNFTVPVVVPNVDCEHCVIRVRYHPNKPTEPIFHECADVRIVKSEEPDSATIGQLFAVAGSSSMFNIARNELVGVAPSGSISELPQPPTAPLLPEGMVTSLAATQSLYFIGNSATDFAADKPASTLYTYNTKTKSWGVPTPLSLPDGPDAQFDAILPSAIPSHPLMVITRVENGTGTEEFKYQLRCLDFDGTISAPIVETEDQQTFVNFMWADVDPVRNMVYFLAGDENSLEVLRALVYTIDINAGTVKTALQDTSKYTLSGLHVNPKDGNVYSVSPGLFVSDHSYKLVRVETTSGAVTEVGDIAPAGVFKFFYGGGVYGSSVTPQGGLLHYFKRTFDDSVVIAEIDLATGNILGAPTLLTGVNGAVAVKSPVYVAPN